jgi:hypothetical protein
VLPARESILVELRRQIARRPTRPDAVAATGVGELDQLLGGGVPKGRVTEIVGRRSSGRTALSLSLLAAATARGEVVALVDVDGMLDARDAAAAGIDLGRMLWVRAGDGKKGLRAADLLLRAGGFGVVVLDVGEVTPRLPDASWVRLHRAAEEARAALVVVTPWRAAGTFAALTLEAARGKPQYVGRAPSPRVLDAVESCIQVVRSKLHAPGGAAGVTFRRRCGL